MGCFCTADLIRAPFAELPRDSLVTRYIAISVQFLELEYAKSGAYAWLRNFQSLERVGKTYRKAHRRMPALDAAR